MNEHTRIFDMVHGNREEKFSMSDIHSIHTLLKFISVDQNTVVSGSAMPPGGDCMNTFTVHAACPA